MPEEVSSPTFRLDGDRVHFWFTHVCVLGITLETLMPHSGGSWRVTQAEPLTVEPSINCLQCGTHGWIRDGAWVDA